MTLPITLAVIVVYIAGFMGTARVLASWDRQEGNEPDGLNMAAALAWPIFAPLGLAVGLVLSLYDLAVRDAGIPRAERRRRRQAKRRAEIADLERWHADYEEGRD